MKIHSTSVIYSLLTIAIFVLLIMWGCSKDQSPMAPPGRVFTGITQRNEFGDTLAVDLEDWIITGYGDSGGQTNRELAPVYRNGVHLADKVSDQVISIGAYPNPFVPGAGHLLIDLILPNTMEVKLYLV